MAHQQKTRTAFTIIELLVVISVLAILTAILIPQLRFINKDRGMREASRVAASAFAQASQRALIDGVAGVLLERNPNFADANGFSYAVQSMSLLRAVPNFRGDLATDVAMAVGAGSTVSIPHPIEQEDLEIIRAGDEISFGNNSLRYTIAAVTPMPLGGPFTTLQLTLDLGGANSYLPNPNDILSSTPLNYTVHRLPRPLRSSRTVLPDSFAIDLRFAGFTMADSGFDPFPSTATRTSRITQVLEPHPRAVFGGGTPIDFAGSDVAILFNEAGGVDRMVLLAFDASGNTVVFERDLVDNLRLFVTEVSVDTDILTNPSANPLNVAENLWVSVNRSSGSTNVGYNAVPAVRQSITDLSVLYNGTLMERTQFNDILSAARGDSDISVAAQ